MKRFLKNALVSVLLMFFVTNPVSAEDMLKPVKTDSVIKPDGILDESVWKRKPDIEEFYISASPKYGEKLSYKTSVWMAYDTENLYFAFFCEDREPDKIKTSITKRDNIWEEDWVGINIDMVGNKQFSYGLICNPNGIQGDLYDTGREQDSSTDYVWYSGGRVVENGYTVEMKIPLKNFRFSSGTDVLMNVLFHRQIPRFGITYSWPPKTPGDTFISAQQPVVYGEISGNLRLEVLPSFTYSGIWDRVRPDEWSPVDDKTDIGVTARYGITSSINMELTINPDYSQVESDEFQVLINQRYPIFYSEKRPFFMEAGNMFNLACADSSGDYKMVSAVHTRKIIDPEWGFKLYGNIGKLSFGFLGTGDEWPGRVLEDEENPLLGKNANYYIGRLKYSLDADNYIGAIYTAKTFGDGYNHVIGGDVKFRLWEDHFLSGKFLYSKTKDAFTLEEKDGLNYSLSYAYYTKPLSAFVVYEDFEQGFQMDTAFYYRDGIRRTMGLISPSWYPDESIPWLKRVNLMLWGEFIHDTFTGEDDYFYFLAFRTYFAKNASFRLDIREFSEYWAGSQLEGSYIWGYGQIQFTNWWYLYTMFDTGDKIYYDSAEPFVGSGNSITLDTIIQPNENLSQEFVYVYENLNHPLTDELVYDVHILRSRSTWQINKYLFLRAIVQWDSSQEIVLTDLLASFTLIPGTVLHLGYGSLHRDVSYKEERWQSNIADTQYYQTTQSIFFKASYLLQF